MIANTQLFCISYQKSLKLCLDKKVNRVYVVHTYTNWRHRRGKKVFQKISIVILPLTLLHIICTTNFKHGSSLSLIVYHHSQIQQALSQEAFFQWNLWPWLNFLLFIQCWSLVLYWLEGLIESQSITSFAFKLYMPTFFFIISRNVGVKYLSCSNQVGKFLHFIMEFYDWKILGTQRIK